MYVGFSTHGQPHHGDSTTTIAVGNALICVKGPFAQRLMGYST